MRSRLMFLVTGLVFNACQVDVHAQETSYAVDRMGLELCGCMSAIDVSAQGRALELGVRQCLEDAVVGHPAAVRALLESTRGSGGEGYQLGTILGRILDERCPSFPGVRERLKRALEQPPKARPAS